MGPLCAGGLGEGACGAGDSACGVADDGAAPVGDAFAGITTVGSSALSLAGLPLLLAGGAGVSLGFRRAGGGALAGGAGTTTVGTSITGVTAMGLAFASGAAPTGLIIAMGTGAPSTERGTREPSDRSSAPTGIAAEPEMRPSPPLPGLIWASPGGTALWGTSRLGGSM